MRNLSVRLILLFALVALCALVTGNELRSKCGLVCNANYENCRDEEQEPPRLGRIGYVISCYVKLTLI